MSAWGAELARHATTAVIVHPRRPGAGLGPSWGAPTARRVLVARTTQLVHSARDGAGAEATPAPWKLYEPGARGASWPVGSRVDLPEGLTVEVVAAEQYESPAAGGDAVTVVSCR